MIGLDTNVLARHYVEDGSDAEARKQRLAAKRLTVERTIAGFRSGLDLADAMHHASDRDCERVASFDDRRFARRVQRSAMLPSVFVPR